MNIYAHGLKGGGFQVVYKNGNENDIFSAKQMIKAISSTSKGFKEKLKAGEEITIKFFVCNERTSKEDEGLIRTISEMTKLNPNITAEVSTGLVVVSYDEDSAELAGVWDKYATPDSEGKKGSYYTVKNGQVINVDSSVGLKPSTPAERKNNAESKSKQYDDPNDDYIDVNKEWKTK